jgi:predicted nucleic acid-binding protein
MRVAIDTNVLAYAEGIDDDARRERAIALTDRLAQLTVFIPVQVLGELFRVLVRKGGQNAKQARERVLGWSDSFALIETSEPVLLAAMDLAEAHRFSIWDAIVVAAAARAECRLLLSEDMQDGFTWNGVTIANPFSETPHPLLAAMLADADRWNAEK